jgi:ABC-type phosphate/phosphonate transport system substrate-binding protein
MIQQRPSRPAPYRAVWFAILALTLSAALAGCRRTVVVTPTPLPTATLTPTPFSTALPTVEPQATYGGDARPYQLLLQAPDASSNAVDGLESFLNDNAGFTFTVTRAESGAAALTALCGATPTLAFVDGWTLLAAQAQGCARPILSYVRGQGSAARTGVSADLIVPATSQASDASGLRGLIYCRLNESDLETWILPTLIMRTAAGFDPFTDFQTVRDVPTLQALVQEVAAGNCVGAVPAGTVGEYGELSAAVRVLQSSPELPFGGVVVSATVSLATADSLSELLVDNATKVRGVIDATTVQGAQQSSIDAMVGFMRQARFDLTALR